jgi:hypothetical protein
VNGGWHRLPLRLDRSGHCSETPKVRRQQHTPNHQLITRLVKFTTKSSASLVFVVRSPITMIRTPGLETHQQQLHTLPRAVTSLMVLYGS